MFDRLTEAVAHWAGSTWAVALSFVVVLIWAALGPFFGWSEGHQLVINTATTIITFWLVFLIQNTQNRHEAALQAKLDALIAAIDQASNRFIGLEKRSEAEIEELRKDLP